MFDVCLIHERRADVTNGTFMAPHGKPMARMLAALAAMSLMSMAVPLTSYADVLTSDCILGETASDEDSIDISAPNAIMTDSNGNVLFERSADERVKIASTTKMMTAYVAIKYGDMDSVVTVGQESADVIGSKAGLQAGDQMSLRDMLVAMMLPSGNDAADAIARFVGSEIDASSSDPYQTFIDRMNDEAEALGMSDTIYENPHGLDVDSYAGDQCSTARDLSRLAVEAMGNDMFRSVVSTATADLTVVNAGTSRVMSLTSTDMLLSSYDGELGIKTGQTELAGSCFVGACKVGDGNGGECYTVVLGEDTKATTFDDTTRMFDWAKRHRRTYNVALGHDAVMSSVDGKKQYVPLMATVAHSDYPDKTMDATVLGDTEVTTYDVLGDVTLRPEFDEVSGDVRAGDKVGTVSVCQGGTVIATLDLVSADDVTGATDIGRLITAVSRAIRLLLGKPTVADDSLIETRSDADDSVFDRNDGAMMVSNA